MHVTDAQSSLGGGGGKVRSGLGGGVFVFSADPKGENSGGRVGLLDWLDSMVGDGAGAGKCDLLEVGNGD